MPRQGGDLFRIVNKYAATAAAALIACGVTFALAETPRPNPPRFVEAAAVAGVDHRYRDGPAPIAAPEKSNGLPALGPKAAGAGAFVVGGGVGVLDCDGDDRLDILLAGGAAPAQFYRNRTAKPGAPIRLRRLRNEAKLLGVSKADLIGVTGVYPFYWDADENPDLYLMRFGEDRLLRGLGGCRFEDATARAKLGATDGWTTAFAAHWPKGAPLPLLAIGSYVDRARPLDKTGNCAPTLLFAPLDSTQYGTPQKIGDGACPLSLLFVDWANDGAAALRISSDRQYADAGVGELLYAISGAWRAPKAHRFTQADGWRKTEIWGMGLAAADLDGDGRPEIAATSMADNRLDALIAAASGAPAYEDLGQKLGALSYRPYVGPDLRPSTSWHIAFEDLNSDGALDLWIVKGNVSVMKEFAAFDPDSILLGQNDASGALRGFTEAGFEAGVALRGRGRGGAAVDLNNDGLLDLIVVQYEGPTRLFQAIPTSAPANYLSVSLRQAGPNPGAIGAHIEVKTPDQREQRRTLFVGGGHASGAAAPTHFGLGAATEARLRVVWPNGDASPWRVVKANTRLVIRRGGAINEAGNE